MDEWFYLKNGERAGPVSAESVQKMLDDRTLTAADLAWQTGMSNWLPFGQLPAFRVAAAALDYASAGPRTGALPPRAAESLRNFGKPTGDTTHWPLNDVDLQHLAVASRYRKVVRRAAALFKGIAIITALVIPVIGVMIAFPIDMLDVGSGELVIGMLISIATVIVCGLGTIGTLRNQLWGPYSVAIVLVVTLLVQIASSIPAMISNDSMRAVAAAAGDVVSALFTALFFVSAIRAIGAINKLRATPAWCQEVMAVAKW